MRRERENFRTPALPYSRSSSSPHSRHRAVLRDSGCRSVRAQRLRRGSVRAAGGRCLCWWRCRGTVLWRVNVSETQSAALLCLCRSRRLSALLSNTHRPQRPAAHLPLKGRGTDFQVANASPPLTPRHVNKADSAGSQPSAACAQQPYSGFCCFHIHAHACQTSIFITVLWKYNHLKCVADFPSLKQSRQSPQQSCQSLFPDMNVGKQQICPVPSAGSGGPDEAWVLNM